MGRTLLDNILINLAWHIGRHQDIGYERYLF